MGKAVRVFLTFKARQTSQYPSSWTQKTSRWEKSGNDGLEGPFWLLSTVQALSLSSLKGMIKESWAVSMEHQITWYVTSGILELMSG
jgi:hypothetical protein